MAILSAILLLALTRAELIDRFRAPSVIRVNGLVEVVGNCPPEMRREFQVPVASFVGDVCEALYAETRQPRKKLAKPGILVTIGDETNAVRDVVVRVKKRDDGEVYTQINLPAPGFADVERVRIETVKAFSRYFNPNEELDDATATARYRRAIPELRIDDQYAAIEDWMSGEKAGEDDEEYLKLSRSVLSPGEARAEDVLRFASSLYLYPAYYDAPFHGGRLQCSFREAVPLSREDMNVRLAAYRMLTPIFAYGMGHGERMNAAVEAYVLFLRELAAGVKSDEELLKLLDEADAKLKGVLDESEESRQP